MKLRETINRLGFTISKSNHKTERKRHRSVQLLVLESSEQTQTKTIQDNLLLLNCTLIILGIYKALQMCANCN